MTCKLCGGPLGLLGVLGKLAHLLCRNCGAQFSTGVECLDLEHEEEL